jgi:hypothetical protein
VIIRQNVPKKNLFIFLGILLNKTKSSVHLKIRDSRGCCVISVFFMTLPKVTIALSAFCILWTFEETVFFNKVKNGC